MEQQDQKMHAKDELNSLRAEIARLRKALAYYAKREDWEMLPGSDYHQALYAACDGWEIAENALGLTNEP